jgi:hypothetical protein
MPFSTFWGPFETHFMCTHTCHMLRICTLMGQERRRGKYCYLSHLGPPNPNMWTHSWGLILSLSNFFMDTKFVICEFLTCKLQTTHSCEDFCHSIWVFLNCGFEAKWLIGNTLLVVIMNFGRVLWVNWWPLIWCVVCQEKSNKKIFVCKNSIEMAKIVIFEPKKFQVLDLLLCPLKGLEIWTKRLDKSWCAMQCD